MTQRELGDRLGWTGATISAIEAADRGVAAEDLADVCRALGVTLDQLLERADPSDRKALGLGTRGP